MRTDNLERFGYVTANTPESVGEVLQTTTTRIAPHLTRSNVILILCVIGTAPVTTVGMTIPTNVLIVLIRLAGTTLLVHMLVQNQIVVMV